METEEIYLVNTAYKHIMANVLRKIEFSKFRDNSLVPLTKVEFNTYTKAIKVKVEIPFKLKKERAMRNNHLDDLMHMTAQVLTDIENIKDTDPEGYTIELRELAYRLRYARPYMFIVANKQDSKD